MIWVPGNGRTCQTAAAMARLSLGLVFLTVAHLRAVFGIDNPPVGLGTGITGGF